jgi:hypothetical protein
MQPIPPIWSPVSDTLDLSKAVLFQSTSLQERTKQLFDSVQALKDGIDEARKNNDILAKELIKVATIVYRPLPHEAEQAHETRGVSLLPKETFFEWIYKFFKELISGIVSLFSE